MWIILTESQNPNRKMVDNLRTLKFTNFVLNSSFRDKSHAVAECEQLLASDSQSLLEENSIDCGGRGDSSFVAPLLGSFPSIIQYRCGSRDKKLLLVTEETGKPLIFPLQSCFSVAVTYVLRSDVHSYNNERIMMVIIPEQFSTSLLADYINF